MIHELMKKVNKQKGYYKNTRILFIRWGKEFTQGIYVNDMKVKYSLFAKLNKPVVKSNTNYGYNLLGRHPLMKSTIFFLSRALS